MKSAKKGKTPRTEDEVVELIRERGRVGRAKYRETMDRKDLPPAAWARHLQEELADGLQYARRVERALLLLERAVVILRRDLHTRSARKWLKDFRKEFAP